ncbi:hypothetical protein, partial [Hoeflea sp.]|uniref:hypothetical protein n=1 Tax=Hoeflea sp. TaxID=1940281 RepID=UPI002AFE71E6
GQFTAAGHLAPIISSPADGLSHIEGSPKGPQAFIGKSRVYNQPRKPRQVGMADKRAEQHV